MVLDGQNNEGLTMYIFSICMQHYSKEEKGSTIKEKSGYKGQQSQCFWHGHPKSQSQSYREVVGR